MRAAFVLLTGCWTTTNVAPAPAIVEQPPLASYVPPHRSSLPRHTVWEGTYVCAQGLSSVELTIDANRDGTATARYDFGPTPSNTTVPNGSYTMKGTLRSTPHGFVAELEPDEWIQHPPNYFAVGLTVEADGGEMTGTIAHATCSEFHAHRR